MIEIKFQDHNNGSGFLVTDYALKNYYRGDNGKSFEWNDEIIEGDGTDNTDIYTSEEGIDYVKSTDGRQLLRLDGLKACAVQEDCAFWGYREDWWNYSLEPSLSSYEEMADWDDIKAFAQRQLQLKTEISKLRTNAENKRASQDIKVLDTAEFLRREAGLAYGDQLWHEAKSLQDGAAQLASTIADIGIGISPLGWAKDAYELISGKGLVDGHSLTETERLLAGIGVMMPGVAGLAFAGMKIIARNPLARQGISRAVAHAEKLTDILGDLKPVRFKEGKNLSEVAIIGRDMTYVREAGARLNAAGIKTRIFELSPDASLSLADNSIRYKDQIIPYDKIPNTLAYKEDMDWVRKIKYDAIPVLDVGNPSGKTIPSRFYDDEILEFFGGRN